MTASDTGGVQLVKAAQFVNTHWSLILVARQTDAPGSREALEKLCAIYWYPLYAFVRRKGNGHHDAEELTQAFFERLLEKHTLARVHPAAGRFRSFLLAAFNHFLANEWDRSQAGKRGGGQNPVSFDGELLETRYGLEPVDPATPETQFERHWALAELGQALAQLQQEYLAKGKGDLFEALKVFLSGDKVSVSHVEIARQHGLGVNSLDVEIHRLRRRYGAVLRAQIALTVGSPAEVEDEIRCLRALFAR